MTPVRPGRGARPHGDVLPKPNPQQPGPVPAEQDELRYWVWTYTAGTGRGDVIHREAAIGGLMKLAGLFYKLPRDGAPTGVLGRFGDGGEISDGYRVLVEFAVNEGVVQGYPDGRLRPSGIVSAAKAAVMVRRVLDRYGPPARSTAPGTEGRAPATPGAKTGVLLTPVAIPVPVQPDGILLTGQPWSAAGAMGLVMHGSAYAEALPVAGIAPAGHLWVLLDVEVFNQHPTDDLSLTQGLRFGLEDPLQMRFRSEMNVAATAALRSPFGDAQRKVSAGRSVRGLVVFAVPVGTGTIWYHVESSLGKAKEKDYPWTSGLRGAREMCPGHRPGPAARHRIEVMQA